MAGVDKPEEGIGATEAERQVADLVDNRQSIAGEEAVAFAELALALGLEERRDDVGECAEEHALAGLDSALTPRAIAKWVLAVANGPRKWATSWRAVKSSAPRARMRLRSREV